MTSDEAVQLEADSRRSIGAGVLHPDLCAKLTLHGVGFAVAPLVPSNSIAMRPDFSGDKVRVEIANNAAEPDKALQELAAGLLATAPIETEVCETCGQIVSAELDMEADNTAFLSDMFGYAAAILRKQYDLSDGQLADLLQFDGNLPEWVAQVMLHAGGK